MFKIKNAELLQLFAEGGAGAGDSPPAAEGQTGVAPAAAGQEESADEAFARFIEKYGEDAKPLRDHHKKNFGKKYATFKETEAKAQRQNEVLKAIAKRYPDIKDGDLDGLEKAFLTDARFFSEEAIAKGRTAEDLAAENYKDVQLERLQLAEKQRVTKEAKDKAAREFDARLLAQAEDMKKTDPEFNLDKELENPMMRNMLLSNIPLAIAYHAVHHEELVKKAAEDAKTATVNSIATKGARAHESASTATPPAVATKDFSKMPRAEFMKIFNSK